MSDKIEPIRHKLTEAIPEPAEEAGRPDDQGQGAPPQAADLKQHNAEARRSREDRMVDSGRGQDNKGRGSQRDAQS